MSNITEPVQLAGGYSAERNKYGTAILHASGGVHMASVCEEALIGEIERLRAQVAEMREDAERYRWLRDTQDPLILIGLPQLTGEDDGEFWQPDELDAAIDRARKSGDWGHG